MNGGRVQSVAPGSIAEDAGIEPGDIIVSLNGHELRDIVDYRYYSAEESVDILVRRGQEEAVIEVEKDFDEPIGVEFADELFDGVRECGNRCIFCFVHQLPKGMRRPLYVRDDDYRLSFLHGNFVTLTNVTHEDIARIIEQRLTPIYVSVHATDPTLRTQMVRTGNAPDVMAQLRTLADAGITLHTQVVVCEGVNDGEQLERTVSDLSGLFPQVASIGIVPVGLTRHRRVGPDIKSVDAPGARQIIELVKRRQKDFGKIHGTRLVWASDELYLSAGVQVPSAVSYEGYPQIENGIGLVRQFMEDRKRTLRRLPERLPLPLSVTLVTSTLAARILEEFAADLSSVKNLTVRVAPIRNKFFGESVTVAGLITGQDVIEQLKCETLADIVMIPSIMQRDGAFLDDVTLDEAASELQTRVVVAQPRPSGILKAILAAATS